MKVENNLSKISYEIRLGTQIVKYFLHFILLFSSGFVFLITLDAHFSERIQETFAS